MFNILKENYIHYINTGKASFFRVDFHLIGGCNFKCIMCDNWKNKIEMNFSYKQIQKIILILKKYYSCNYIRFHGQEPTLYSKLEDIIFFSKKIGLKVAIKTNAWLLDDIRLIKIIKYGIDEIYLSIDGPNNSIHDSIRGKQGSFDKNIELIKKARLLNKNIKIYINSVIIKHNYKYLLGIIDLGIKYKLNRVSFVFLNNKNKSNIKYINLSKEEFIRFFKKDIANIYLKGRDNIAIDFSPFLLTLSGKNSDYIISELKYNFSFYEKEINAFYKGDYGKYFYDKYGCYGPLDHCSINFNGDIFGCCVIERKKENSVGNILRSDLEKLWDTNKYIKYRKDSNYKCIYHNKCASNFYARKHLFKEIYLDDILYPKNKPLNYYRYLKELYNENIDIQNNIKVKKLKTILLKFFSNLRFYRELLIKNNISKKDIENISSLDFLKKLPIINKAFLKKHFKEIKGSLAEEFILKGKTSGESGNELTFLYPLSFNRFIKQIAIFSEESSFSYDDKYFSLTPINCNQTIINNIKEPNYVKKVYITIGRFKYSKNIFTNIKKIFERNKDINFLHGDSKYILFIILLFRKYNSKLPKLLGIFITYSYTNITLKKFLEKEFKCKVFDNYGCSETGPISIEITGKKYVFGDNIILENNIKNIVVTDLDNDIFPFIKYENGDLGEIHNNIINLYGKRNQVLNGKNLRDIDLFFYKEFGDIIFYQFNGDEFVYLSNILIDEKKLKKQLYLFLDKNFKINKLLENEFFKIGNCSKIKIIN